MLPSADRLYKGLSADFFALGVNKTPLIGRRGCLLHTLDFNFFCKIFGFFVIHHAVFSGGVVRGYLKKQKTALGNIAGSGLEVQSRW